MFHFSRRAETDLLSIGDYTLRTWGKIQAAHYIGELQVCCQTLADILHQRMLPDRHVIDDQDEEP